ncbi:MAG: hypothetical protein U0V74_15955 [Chitinophagales bacterium]
MEFKLIVYIIIGIIYFIYSVTKKKDDKKPVPQGKAKPVTPPSSASNTLEDILNEIKRKQAEQQKAQQQQTQPKPKVTTQPVYRSKPAKDVLVHEKKVKSMQEGGNYESVFERELTDEEKVERGNIKLANEGIYKIETVEEAEARSLVEGTTSNLQMDPRDAFLGSIIFERKF